MWTFIVTLLFCVSRSEAVSRPAFSNETVATLTIKFINFTNPLHVLSDGKKCDDGFLQSRLCDPHFKICFLTNETMWNSNATDSVDICDFGGPVIIGPYTDMGEVTFESVMVGGVNNPITLNISRAWQGAEMRAHVNEMERSRFLGPNAFVGPLIDQFYYFFNWKPSPSVSRINLRGFTVANATMSIEATVQCVPDYYSSDCSIYCSPNHRHSCDKETGAYICNPGWTGDSCEAKILSDNFTFHELQFGNQIDETVVYSLEAVKAFAQVDSKPAGLIRNNTLEEPEVATSTETATVVPTEGSTTQQVEVGETAAMTSGTTSTVRSGYSSSIWPLTISLVVGGIGVVASTMPSVNSSTNTTAATPTPDFGSTTQAASHTVIGAGNVSETPTMVISTKEPVVSYTTSTLVPTTATIDRTTELSLVVTTITPIAEITSTGTTVPTSTGSVTYSTEDISTMSTLEESSTVAATTASTLTLNSSTLEVTSEKPMAVGSTEASGVTELASTTLWTVKPSIFDVTPVITSASPPTAASTPANISTSAFPAEVTTDSAEIPVKESALMQDSTMAPAWSTEEYSTPAGELLMTESSSTVSGGIVIENATATFLEEDVPLLNTSLNEIREPRLVIPANVSAHVSNATEPPVTDRTSTPTPNFSFATGSTSIGDPNATMEFTSKPSMYASTTVTSTTGSAYSNTSAPDSTMATVPEPMSESTATTGSEHLTMKTTAKFNTTQLSMMTSTSPDLNHSMTNLSSSSMVVFAGTTPYSNTTAEPVTVAMFFNTTVTSATSRPFSPLSYRTFVLEPSMGTMMKLTDAAFISQLNESLYAFASEFLMERGYNKTSLEQLRTSVEFTGVAVNQSQFYPQVTMFASFNFQPVFAPEEFSRVGRKILTGMPVNSTLVSDRTSQLTRYLPSQSVMVFLIALFAIAIVILVGVIIILARSPTSGRCRRSNSVFPEDESVQGSPRSTLATVRGFHDNPSFQDDMVSISLESDSGYAVPTAIVSDHPQGSPFGTHRRMVRANFATELPPSNSPVRSWTSFLRGRRQGE